MISGKPEKESTIRILDMQMRSSDVQNRDPIEAMRWQYHVTTGVILKAINQDFDNSAVITALYSTKVLIGFVKPNVDNADHLSFFSKANNNILFYVDKMVNGSSVSDKDKSQMTLFCTDVTERINNIIASLGETLVIDKDGVEM